MEYSKRRFGAELILEIEKGYDVERPSKWADSLESGYEDLEDVHLREIVRTVGAMSSDPQFALSEDPLLDLALSLVKS